MSLSNHDYKWNVIHDDDDFNGPYWACSVYKDRFIVVAGCCTMDLDSVAMFDVFNASSSSLPNAPYERSKNGGLVVNNYFYVVDDDGMYRLDLCDHENDEDGEDEEDEEEWEEVYFDSYEPTMEMITDGNNLFFIGIKKCMDNRESEFQLCRYDPRADYCTCMSSIPREIIRVVTTEEDQEKCMTFVDNKIYFIHSSCHMVFDIDARSWSLCM